MTDERLTELLDGIAQDQRTHVRRAADTPPESGRKATLQAWAAVAGIVLLVALAGTSDRASAAQATCHEDEHCWQWPTMGNHRRGVTTIGGRFLIVGPCRFAHIRPRIDWSRTRHLPRDWSAGCN